MPNLDNFRGKCHSKVEGGIFVVGQLLAIIMSSQLPIAPKGKHGWSKDIHLDTELVMWCISSAGRPAVVVVGGLSISGTDGQKYKVAKVINHLQYNHSNYKNDISLVKLAEKIKFSDKVGIDFHIFFRSVAIVSFVWR